MRIFLDNAILVRGHGGASGLARSLHGLSEERICDYLGFLREAAEIVLLNPLLIAPIRDVNDAVVLLTAVIGDADILCTRDRDFFEPPAQDFLQKAGIAVLPELRFCRGCNSG